jgi:dCMP deaminase
MIIQAGIKNVYLRTGNGPDAYRKVKAEELSWVVGSLE